MFDEPTQYLVVSCDVREADEMTERRPFEDIFLLLLQPVELLANGRETALGFAEVVRASLKSQKKL